MSTAQTTHPGYTAERAELVSGGPATTFTLEIADEVARRLKPGAVVLLPPDAFAMAQGNPHLTDAYKAHLEKQAWYEGVVASIERAIANRIAAMAAGPVQALAYNIFQSACMAFAPHHIGGAPLLYRPVWAKMFEKDHPDWHYETELLRGRGCVYFPVATGIKLWERLVKGVGDVKPFSRRGQGGEFEVAAIQHEGEEVDVVRFRPDAKPYVESLIVLPGGAPEKRKLVLPNGVTRPAGAR